MSESSFARAIGGKITISVCGRDFLVKPASMGTWSAVQHEMRLRKQENIPALMKSLDVADISDATKAMMIEKAIDKLTQDSKINIEETMQWAMSELEGIAFLAWLLVEESYPGELSRKQVYQHFAESQLEDLLAFGAKVHLAQGTDPVGNANGAVAAKAT